MISVLPSYLCHHNFREQIEYLHAFIGYSTVLDMSTVWTHAEGKPIPTELRREEAQLRHDIELEDDNTAVPRSHIDDEYAHAQERDPRILISTSRDPSSRLVQFAKELKLVFPNAQRINRGGQVPARWTAQALPAPNQRPRMAQ